MSSMAVITTATPVFTLLRLVSRIYCITLFTLTSRKTIAAAAICIGSACAAFFYTIGTCRVAFTVAVIAVSIGVAVIIDTIITTGLSRWRRATILGTITLVLIRITGIVATERFYAGRVGVTIRIITVCVGVAVIVVTIGTACLG